MKKKSLNFEQPVNKEATKDIQFAQSGPNGIYIDKGPGYIRALYDEKRLIIFPKCKRLGMNVEPIQIPVLIVFVLAMLFFYGKVINLMEDKTISPEFGVGIIVLYLCIVLIVISGICLFITSESYRRYLAAQHMIINYWQNNHKLPKNLEALQNCSRIRDSSSTTDNIRRILSFMLMSGIIAVEIPLGMLAKKLFELSDNMSTIVNCSIMFVTILIFTFYLENRKISSENQLFYKSSLKVSRKLQLIRCTSANVSERELVLAYFLLTYWVKETQPGYYSKIYNDMHEQYWVDQLNKMGYYLEVE